MNPKFQNVCFRLGDLSKEERSLFNDVLDKAGVRWRSGNKPGEGENDNKDLRGIGENMFFYRTDDLFEEDVKLGGYKEINPLNYLPARKAFVKTEPLWK